MDDPAHPHLVIVGGGFAGLWATRALKSAPLRITLIDRCNHHLFQPLLYQVATAGLSSPDIAAPLQLNRGEGRHSLARAMFHGKRGELRQRYREGQEDQLGALGLVLNAVVLWNTIYLDAALAQLRREGYPIHDADVARLSPLIHEHINMLGRYSFSVPEAVSRGELRPLRNPAEQDT